MYDTHHRTQTTTDKYDTPANVCNAYDNPEAPLQSLLIASIVTGMIPNWHMLD